jgi:hypothetical protein
MTEATAAIKKVIEINKNLDFNDAITSAYVQAIRSYL